MTNPLSLETSDLDPITPEEDALATAIIAAEGVTRQSLHRVVRCIRAGLAKAGAVIVPVEATEAMLEASWQATRAPSPDVRMAHSLMGARESHKSKSSDRWKAMLSAHSIQSGGEGAEG